MTNPLITIGITAYNAEKTIQRCILSAFSQTWRPFEVIVIDDCSHDETLNIVNQVSENSSNIRVFINSTNSGVAFTRNRIINEANGEFIIFFDDDDESLPERISIQYKRIIDYEKQFAGGAPVICHTARTLRYPSGEVRFERTMGQTLLKSAPSGPAVARRILFGQPLQDGYGACPTCSQMARLSTYRHLGGFDESLRRGEDTDFNIRLALAGGHFVGIAEPLVIQNMTKTSEKNLQVEYEFMKRLLYKHRNFMEQAGQFNFGLDWLDLKQAWMKNHHTVFTKLLFKLIFLHPILTIRRLIFAVPNIGLNKAFSHFHSDLPR